VRKQDCQEGFKLTAASDAGRRGAAAKWQRSNDWPEAIGCMLMGNPEQRRKSGRVRLEGSLQTRGEPLPLITVVMPLAEIAIG
jgi:hypothetical protein